MHNEVPLLQKSYDFYKSYYAERDHFPKKSREVLTVKIENAALDLIQLISQTSFAAETEKVRLLDEASARVDYLKLLFRLCFELRIIDQKKYFIFEAKISGIGRMIGGWLISASRSQSRSG